MVKRKENQPQSVNYEASTSSAGVEGDEEIIDNDDDTEPEMSEELKKAGDHLFQQIERINELRRLAAEDASSVVNFWVKYNEEAEVHAKKKTTAISKIAKSLTINLFDFIDRGDEKEDDEQEIIDEEDEIEAQEQEKLPDPAKTNAGMVTLHRYLANKVKTDFESVGARKGGLTYLNSFALKTVTSSVQRLSYWIIFLSTLPDLSVDEAKKKGVKAIMAGNYNGERIGEFYEFLRVLRTKKGRVDRVGKPYEPSTIVGIIFSIFHALKILGYIDVGEKFQNLLSKERFAIIENNLKRTIGRDPIVRIPIYPQDILYAVGRMKFKSLQEHQNVSYLLLKMATLLRKSSILPVRGTGSPGLKLCDFEFFVDDSSYPPVVSMRVCVKYEKHIKESGSKNYGGRIITLRGRHDRTCVVQFMLIHFLYLEAFERDYATMVQSRSFKHIKPHLKEMPVFRMPDKLGQLTTKPLTDDTGIFDALAPSLGLPRRRIGGHALRHGGAMWIAEGIIKDNEGFNSTSVGGLFKMTGAWIAGGYTRYAQPAITKSLNMVEAIFGTGQTPELLVSVYDQRDVVFGLSKDEYVDEKHPIVLRALEHVNALEPFRKDKQDRYSEMKALYEKFGLNLDQWRRAVEIARFNALKPDDQDTLRSAKTAYKQAQYAFWTRARTFAATFASYANQFLIQEKRQKLERREVQVAIVNFDMNRMASSVERFVTCEGKWNYGPFSMPPTENLSLECWFIGCSEHISGIQEFLLHIDEHKANEMAESLPGNPAKRMKLECTGEHGSRLMCKYKACEGLFNHNRICHHLVNKCEDCHQFFKCREGGTHATEENHSVKLVTNFIDYGDFLKKGCDSCKDIRCGLTCSWCVTELAVVNDVLKVVPGMRTTFINALAKGSKNPLTLSQEESLSQGNIAAGHLCSMFSLKSTSDDQRSKEVLQEQCPCLYKRIQEWRSSLDSASKQGNDL